MWFCTLWNMFFWGSEKWTDPMLNHTAGGVSIGKAIHNNRGIQQMARQMDPVLGDTTRCCPCLLIYNHYELVWYTINPTVFAVFTCSPGRSPGKNKFCVCPRATSRVTWFVLFWHCYFFSLDCIFDAFYGCQLFGGPYIYHYIYNYIYMYTLSYSVISYRITSWHIISYHIVSYQSISYHLIWDHFISCIYIYTYT